MSSIKNNFSFELVGTRDPSAPVAAEAVLADAPESGTGEDTERPSDTAILVGTGLVGWMVGGPFLAIITAFGGKYSVDKNGVLGESSKALGRITAAVAEAVLSKAPDSCTGEDTERPSATAIMVGMGLVGWVVGGPFLALITALGGKYAADKNGMFGEFSIAVGRITAGAGKMAEEERLLDKLKAAILSLFSKKNSQGFEKN